MSFREWIRHHNSEDSWQWYLVNCMWCVSVYVGSVLVGLTAIFVDVPYPYLVWGTCSAVTGILGLICGKLDD